MKYTRAQNAIVDLIARQELEEGDRLPNEIDLSEHCGVSTITTRRALQELSHLGIVERHQGRGTFVKQAPANGRRVGTVAFLVVGTETGLYERMLGSAQRALLRRGYALKHVAVSTPDDETAREISGVEGALVTGVITPEWLSFLEAMSTPFVVLGNCEATDAVWRVDYDWTRAVELLTQEMLDRGCRTLGLLNAARRFLPARQAHAAFSRVLGEAGIPLANERVMWARRGEYAQRIREFFAANRTHLDGLVVEQNVFPHVLAWFYEHGWPGTRPILGVFSDSPILHSPYEKIIEVGFADDLTKRGVEQLFEVIGGSEDSPGLRLLEPCLSGPT